MADSIHVRVRLFAVLRDLAGGDRFELEVPATSSVQAVLEEILSRHESIRPHAVKIATAVNLEYVRRDHRLSDGDELALIPPVSGG